MAETVTFYFHVMLSYREYFIADEIKQKSLEVFTNYDDANTYAAKQYEFYKDTYFQVMVTVQHVQTVVDVKTNYGSVAHDAETEKFQA